VIDPAGHEQDRAVLPDRAGLLVQAREDDDLHGALEVLERHHGHHGPRPRHHRPGSHHDPAHDEPLPVE
jgi:hypothetical protein